LTQGFAIFWLLAAMVFMATFAGVIALRYQAASSVNQVATDTHHKVTVTADVARLTAPRQAAARPVEQEKESGSGSKARTLLAGLFDDADEPEATGASRTASAPDAQHAAWVDELYVQLNSLEPPAAGAEDTTPVISGRVLTRTGRPVSGIEVSAQLRDYFRTPDSDMRTSSAQQTTTNSNGFYAFRDIQEGIYMIGTPESGGYAPARIEVRTGVKYADLVLDSLGVAQVSGVVTDTMGTELAGVRIMPLVKGIPEGAVSNNDGEFEFDVALQGETRSFPVRFQLDGYREVRHQVTENDWTGDNRLALTVTMEPVYEFSTVSGSVTDANGVQVAGETVRLYSPSLKRNYRAVSDAAGGYLFAEVEAADDYQLWVRPAGPYSDFTEQGLQLSQGSLRRDIELASLERSYRLSGRLLDQDGRPVPNFTLTLRSQAASGQRLPLTSDDDGDFVVEHVPGGELVIESRTMPYYNLSGLQLSGDRQEHHVNLVVNRGQHKLLGQVVNSDGRPVATPKISITSTQVVNGIRSRSSSNTSADARGYFLFTDLGAGPHTVTVNAPGYDGVRVQPVVGVQNELVVQLEENSI